MFTGIVKACLPIVQLEHQQDFATFTLVLSPVLGAGLENGASVALNGTCLTVRHYETLISGEYRVSFDAIGQTLAVTNLGQLTVGDCVNVERAARFGDEIGGHMLSGHVMTTVVVVNVDVTDYNCVVWFERSSEVSPYLLDKGYVALNGCSLTIAEVEDNRFSIHLIPETRDVTTFGDVNVGDRINLEVDPQTQAVVDTVTRVLAARPVH